MDSLMTTTQFVDLGAVLHGVQAAPSTLSFPRAKDETAVEYYRDYAREIRPLMLPWVRERLLSFVEMFGLTPDVEGEARVCVELQAEREIQRWPNANEKRLIGECVRDLMIAQQAMQKREREQAREIL